ncbi:PTS sugar transporter subunit IIA, partial [Staphylococcus arlettae]
MALEILTSDKVQIKDHVEHWSEAIDIAAQPLLNQRYFDQPYITAMINSVESLGPYIVIAPEIAIAHARPDS